MKPESIAEAWALLETWAERFLRPPVSDLTWVQELPTREEVMSDAAPTEDEG